MSSEKGAQKLRQLKHDLDRCWYAPNQQPTKRLSFDETDNQIAVLLVLIISGSFHFVVDDGANLFFRGGIVIGRLPVKLDQNVCRGNAHYIVKIMHVVVHKILLEIGF